MSWRKWVEQPKKVVSVINGKRTHITVLVALVLSFLEAFNIWTPPVWLWTMFGFAGLGFLRLGVKNTKTIIEQMMKELQGRVAVLLMGTDPVNFFTGHGSADLSGLDVTNICQLMPKSVKLVVASVNPAQSLKGGAGEVRFAIQKFARLSKEYR